MSPLDSSQPSSEAIPTFDVLIVGAGFSGLYLLHRFRKLGLKARAIEAGTGVGGTWYWNRYPGARCDVESMQYSFSFSDELQQDWTWSERFSAQPEILRYANHVADRFGLRRDIELETRVTAAHFDEKADQWRITTDRGASYTARYFIPATGCLSTARTPDFKGRDSFKGRTFHTGHWPHEPVSFKGERVAVIGTGSSAIQAIPVIAEAAAHLTVFQRTPNYSIPSRNEPMPDWYEKEWKENYTRRRAEARKTKNGIVTQFGEYAALEMSEADRLAEFEARWQSGGTTFMQAFRDLVLDQAANDTAAEFVRGKIRQIVKDPKVAELLAPKDYPIGTKRICVDSHYFETYNRPNVSLVDIKSSPIEEITPDGVKVGGKVYAVDSIVYATGFDAMTGALAKIDVRGRNNEALAEKWAAGPRTYLGLMSAGFPNMFMITGPGSPSVLSNMMVSIEQHVDWTVEAISHMQKARLAVMEPTKAAEDEWVVHNNEVAHKTLYPKAASWYMGANIPGKPRIFLPYIGGVGVYRDKCTEIAANGYQGFALSPARASTG